MKPVEAVLRQRVLSLRRFVLRMDSSTVFEHDHFYSDSCTRTCTNTTTLEIMTMGAYLRSVEQVQEYIAGGMHCRSGEMSE